LMRSRTDTQGRQYMNKFLVFCGLLVFCAGSGYCERTQLGSLIEQAGVQCSTVTLIDAEPCRSIGIDMAILGRNNQEKLAEGFKGGHRGKIAMTLMAFKYIGDPDSAKYLEFIGRYRWRAHDDELLLLYHKVMATIYSAKSLKYIDETPSGGKNWQLLDMARYAAMAEQGAMQAAYPMLVRMSTDTAVHLYITYAYAFMGDEEYTKTMLDAAAEKGAFSPRDVANIKQELRFALTLNAKYPDETVTLWQTGGSPIRIHSDSVDRPVRSTPKTIEKLKLEYAYELAVKTQDREEWDWAFGFLSRHPLNPKYVKRLRDLAAKAVSEEHRRQAGEFVAFFDKRTKELDEQEAAAKAERKKRTPEMILEVRLNDLIEEMVTCSSPIYTVACVPAINDMVVLGKNALPLIINKGLHHPREEVRRVIVTALGMIGDPSTIELMKELAMNGSSDNIRALAVSDIANIPHEKTVGILRQFLYDKSDSVRFSAALGLAKYGDMRARDVLVAFAKSNSNYTDDSVSFLAELGDKTSLEVVESLRNRQDVSKDTLEFHLRIGKALNKADPDHRMTPEQVFSFKLHEYYKIASEGKIEDGLPAIRMLSIYALSNSEAENSLKQIAYNSLDRQVSLVATGELERIRDLRKRAKEKLKELGN